MTLLLTVDRFDRLLDKFTVGDGCWEWTGAKAKGYGYFRAVDGRTSRACRVIYELFVGPIPEGLTIDHLCRNKACVRLSHLEAVTMQTNLLRADGVSGRASRKTHCPQGHPYAAFVPGGVRYCSICKREQERSRKGYTLLGTNKTEFICPTCGRTTRGPGPTTRHRRACAQGVL